MDNTKKTVDMGGGGYQKSRKTANSVYGWFLNDVLSLPKSVRWGQKMTLKSDIMG